MRFIHLKHQAIGGEGGVDTYQCLKAIAKAIEIASDAWYWIDATRMDLKTFEKTMEFYREFPDIKHYAYELKDDYLDTKRDLEYLKNKLQDLAKAFEEIAKKCGYRSKTLEDTVKHLEFSASNIDRLLKLLDEAYETKNLEKLDSLQWALNHDIPYAVRDKTSKLATIVNSIATKIGLKKIAI